LLRPHPLNTAPTPTAAVNVYWVTWNRRFLPALQQHLVQKYGAAKAADFYVFGEVAASPARSATRAGAAPRRSPGYRGAASRLAGPGRGGRLRRDACPSRSAGPRRATRPVHQPERLFHSGQAGQWREVLDEDHLDLDLAAYRRTLMRSSAGAELTVWAETGTNSQKRLSGPGCVGDSGRREQA
jgi:hypothetical protein